MKIIELVFYLNKKNKSLIFIEANPNKNRNDCSIFIFGLRMGFFNSFIIYNKMRLIELVFVSKKEMNEKMEKDANNYEGYIPGRNGYNFPNKDGSYTIAYLKGDFSTKNHEIRHAMFYFNKMYRKMVFNFWKSMDLKVKKTIISFLIKCGYKEECIIDEFQAYACTEDNPNKFFGLKKESLDINCLKKFSFIV